MATPVPPQAQGTDPAKGMAMPPVSPYPVPPQYVPDPTGAYRKVIAQVSPFQMQPQGAAPGGPPVSENMGPPQITSNALTRRMQRNEDQARRQQEQPPSPIASQSI